MPADLSLDKESVIQAVQAGKTGMAADQMQTDQISMPPEARLLLFTAKPSAFATFRDFAAAALLEWQHKMEIGDAILRDYLNRSDWAPLSGQERDGMVRHMNYAFASELAEQLAGEVEAGVCLYKSWDSQAAIYATRQNYVAFFWNTYV